MQIKVVVVVAWLCKYGSTKYNILYHLTLSEIFKAPKFGLRIFWGVLIVAPIRSSPSIKLRSTPLGAKDLVELNSFLFFIRVAHNNCTAED